MGVDYAVGHFVWVAKKSGTFSQPRLSAASVIAFSALRCFEPIVVWNQQPGCEVQSICWAASAIRLATQTNWATW
jgi:hypothetical protein